MQTLWVERQGTKQTIIFNSMVQKKVVCVPSPDMQNHAVVLPTVTIPIRATPLPDRISLLPHHLALLPCFSWACLRTFLRHQDQTTLLTGHSARTLSVLPSWLLLQRPLVLPWQQDGGRAVWRKPLLYNHDEWRGRPSSSGSGDPPPSRPIAAGRRYSSSVSSSSEGRYRCMRSKSDLSSRRGTCPRGIASASMAKSCPRKIGSALGNVSKPLAGMAEGNGGTFAEKSTKRLRSGDLLHPLAKSRGSGPWHTAQQLFQMKSSNNRKESDEEERVMSSVWSGGLGGYGRWKREQGRRARGPKCQKSRTQDRRENAYDSESSRSTPR
ncbi:unnamed protein product [Discosporangium mesarthrocarpum]